MSWGTPKMKLEEDLKWTGMVHRRDERKQQTKTLDLIRSALHGKAEQRASDQVHGDEGSW